MESPAQWIVLAHILRPQGRKGEVLADLFTDFPERFDQHPQVWLAPSGFADRASSGEPSDESNPGASVQPAQVAAHWLPVGRNAGRIVFHFAGIDSIEKAQQLAAKDVLVPLAERMPLPTGAAYISDLIGCTVYDRGQPLGVVEGVQFPTSPDGLRRLEEAAPLLEVKSPEGDEVLIPFAEALLLDVDLAAKSIRMTLPEGLAQINRPTQE
ncbi:MAG: ribosome maturation factor RimM [Acidobacteriaceae bacterium]|jgi:16S rRNA processing protein RimM